MLIVVVSFLHNGGSIAKSNEKSDGVMFQLRIFVKRRLVGVCQGCGTSLLPSLDRVHLILERGANDLIVRGSIQLGPLMRAETDFAQDMRIIRATAATVATAGEMASMMASNGSRGPS
jgi:hypothetical protein